MPLRLKSLELQGYKTFASRTLFEFAGGITAIVGPNGSGKSNIADAMRWVLGEQSYTLLRGKKTEDMIFSGSEHRPRAGMAQAAVIFDNSDNWLPVDYTEVALARHAFRDGRNDYLMNGHHVRLRDINELLAQAGLSERTYTILGQGLVDASLALKADERRRLFEEAAGVGLYRSRREEALRRLEHTERNLERVLDIISELEPRLRSLERQAKRAIDYSRAQSDLKVILRDWYGYHWHHDQQTLAESRENVRAQEKRVEAAGLAFQKSQAEYTSYRERISGLRAELNAWHRQLAELHSQRESISRELAVLDERRRALLASQHATLAELERSAYEEKLALDRLSETESETVKQQVDYEEAQSQLRSVQKALQDRQTERAEIESQLSASHDRLNVLNNQRAENQARLDELLNRLETGAQKLRQTRQSLDASVTALQTVEASLREAESGRQQAESDLQNAEQQLAHIKQEAERLEHEKRNALEQRIRQEAEITRIRAQIDVLVSAEESLSGYADGARFLLEAARNAKLKSTRGALSAAMDVPVELETALAAALGDSLDAVLLDAAELEDALRLLEAGESGRAALLPVVQSVNGSLPQPRDEDCLGIASELVRVPEDLRAVIRIILGQTLIVKNRASAMRLIKNLPVQARVVTLRGEVFRGDGLVIAGRTASVTSLARPRQKRELEATHEELTGRLKVTNVKVDRVERELGAVQSEVQQAQSNLEAARQRLDRAQDIEQHAALEVESTRRQNEWDQGQVNQLETESREADSNRQNLQKAQTAVENEVGSLNTQIRELTIKFDEIPLDEMQSQVSYWSTRAAVVEQGMQGAISKKEERSTETRRLEMHKSELSAKLQEVETAGKNLEAEKESLHERELAFNRQIEELQLKMGPAEKDLESAEQAEIRLQESEAAEQRALSHSERALSQLQLELVRRQEMLNTLQGKIVDDFGLVEFEYADEISGPVPLPFEGLVEQLPVVTELPFDLEQQLTTMRARLRRLGPVNPEARQEFEVESERYSFMKTQVDDLHKAEADLKQVISELDELTRRDFIKTFEAVDKEFRQSFVRLFGGGSAKLSLTDPDNLVETGIEIEARLPGRREQGLALLSGGERSLTAIALVFALLKVSPTPVCVLDEVDAMLDEANVGRFRDLLAELSRETQFIIITHNRNTVQAADVIYGVTMGRDSTSQVISLRLDEVTDELLVRG